MNAGRRWPSQVRLSDFAEERTVSLDSTEAILVTVAAYGLSVVMMALGDVLPSVFTVPFVVLSLSFVPGALLVLALDRPRLRVTAEHVLYAFGSSLMILMTVGVLVNLLLPLVGVEKPLMALPLGAGVTLAVGLLATLAWVRNPAGTVVARVPPLWSPVPLALCSLPLLAIIGVSLVNATGINVLLVVVLLAVGVVPLLVVRGLDRRWHPLAIWTVALSILYHKSLWQYAGFGGRPHGIEAWETGRWSPGVVSIDSFSSELVQNGVLFPLFARLSDVFIMTQYEVVNPFFISFLPLALYVTFRRYVDAETAFLGAAVFAFAHPFYLQYPTAGRAGTPVLFLGLFAVALSNDGLSPASRAGLAVTFLTGVVVSHYGTSYYVAAAFLGAVGLQWVLRLVDGRVGERLRSVVHAPDGGTISRDSMDARRTAIFSTTTVFFFLSAALGWYLYTRGGWKFDLLPKHVRDNLVTLVTDPSVQGRTASRIQETYTSTSIEVAKYIYVLLAVLMVVGLAAAFYRRLVGPKPLFDDHFLTIAAALFGIFGVTIVLRNWGGGRPMMITFSFTAVFAVIGARWLVAASERAGAELGVGQRLRSAPDLVRTAHRRYDSIRPVGTHAFATLLLVLFVLNTGVAAATVFGGYSPSNVPAQATLAADKNPQSQVTVHRETDIVTHVWLVEHLDSSYDVYGDTFAARQYDWYRPDITARTPALGGGYTPETKPEGLDVDAQRAGTEQGYLLIMGHNLALEALWPERFGAPVPLDDLSLERQNRIYTTGESHVYFSTDDDGRSSSVASPDDQAVATAESSDEKRTASALRPARDSPGFDDRRASATAVRGPSTHRRAPAVRPGAPLHEFGSPYRPYSAVAPPGRRL